MAQEDRSRMDDRSGAAVGDVEGWPVGGRPRRRADAGPEQPTWTPDADSWSSSGWADDPWAAQPQDQDALGYAVSTLRGEVDRLPFRFEVPGVLSARQERKFVLDRLDGYVLPRISQPDSPLLVVIGGSTGAGKSTLTNSLIGVDVSPAGFLRPTTRQPVLVHNPTDAAAFLSPRVLPGLARVSSTGYPLDGAGPALPGAPTIQLVPHPAVPPGLAIVDSPDLDSLAETNRSLARQLFRAADLWIFVTTGTDYADAVPWQLLAEAVDRQIAVAVVLDRMRPGELDPVRVHFATMLLERGLGAAPVFTLPETPLLDGLLPVQLVAPLQGWLDRQASEAVRTAHIDRAVDGAMAQVLDRISMLADAADDQLAVDRRLRHDLDTLFGRAREIVLTRAVDGFLPGQPPVAAAWQRVAEGSDSWPRVRFTRRVSAALRGGIRYVEVSNVLRGALVTLVVGAVGEAFDLIGGHWRSHPGALLQLGDGAAPFGVSPTLHSRAEVAVTDWQQATLEFVRPGGRVGGVAAEDPLVLALTTLAVGATGAIGSAAEGLLEAESGAAGTARDAVRVVRDDLLRRLSDLVTSEADRLRGVLDAAGMDRDHGTLLRAATAAVRELLPPR